MNTFGGFEFSTLQLRFGVIMSSQGLLADFLHYNDPGYVTSLSGLRNLLPVKETKLERSFHEIDADPKPFEAAIFWITCASHLDCAT